MDHEHQGNILYLGAVPRHRKIVTVLYIISKYWKVTSDKLVQEGQICVCYTDHEHKGYFFKELSQLLSPGIPRAHGLLRSHHGAHTPALTVLC